MFVNPPQASSKMSKKVAAARSKLKGKRRVPLAKSFHRPEKEIGLLRLLFDELKPLRKRLCRGWDEAQINWLLQHVQFHITKQHERLFNQTEEAELAAMAEETNNGGGRGKGGGNGDSRGGAPAKAARATWPDKGASKGTAPS